MPHTVHTLNHKIEEAIKTLSSDFPANPLYEPIKYILSIGGKRIRPLLTLLATDMFGGNLQESLSASVGIEVFHNSTLLHDDLMDKSDLRRGKPTVHKVWNENAAILSGDAMMLEAFNLVAQVSEKALPQALNLFTSTTMGVLKGQQLDMDFEDRADVTEAEYIEMITLKTAVLLGCSLKMGALLANASAHNCEHIYNYGINIGIAFQLKDDLLDVYGDAKTFGKNLGGDIVNNKKTYLLIKALKTADKKQHAELTEWLGKEKFDNEEKIKAVKRIYDALNLKSISENLIEKYYLAALDCISAINVADDRKNELIALSESLMHRDK